MTTQTIRCKQPACGLCDLLAEGKTATRNGVEISPVCPRCELHHWPSGACPAGALPKSRCPRCKTAKRALEHIPESGRWERRRYARFCEACLSEEGYELVAQTITYPGGELPSEVSWWRKPLTADERQAEAELDVWSLFK